MDTQVSAARRIDPTMPETFGTREGRVIAWSSTRHLASLVGSAISYAWDGAQARGIGSGRPTRRPEGPRSPSVHRHVGTNTQRMDRLSGDSRLQKDGKMDLGRFVLVFLLLKALALGGCCTPTFWLLLYFLIPWVPLLPPSVLVPLGSPLM